jgi:hypothetical protein
MAELSRSHHDIRKSEKERKMFPCGLPAYEMMLPTFMVSVPLLS